MNDSPTKGRDYESSLAGFRSMPPDEWNGLLQSLARGGVLEPEEHRAFEVVLKERSPGESVEEVAPSSELVERHQLVDVATGELIPATVENAHRVLAAATEYERRIRKVKAQARDFLIEESQRQGTKTFHTPNGDVVLSGGPSTEIDGHELAQLLRDAGCPEERIAEVVTEEITYKVNRNVLRQLTGANEDYKAAADLATSTVEKPWRASAK